MENGRENTNRLENGKWKKKRNGLGNGTGKLIEKSQGNGLGNGKWNRKRTEKKKIQTGWKMGKGNRKGTGGLGNGNRKTNREKSKERVGKWETETETEKESQTGGMESGKPIQKSPEGCKIENVKGNNK